jgi:hypothetical protein
VFDITTVLAAVETLLVEAARMSSVVLRLLVRSRRTARPRVFDE